MSGRSQWQKRNAHCFSGQRQKRTGQGSAFFPGAALCALWSLRQCLPGLSHGWRTPDGTYLHWRHWSYPHLFFHGKEKAKNLVQNCINCEACKHICAAGIDLPRLIKEIHARILDEEGHPLPSLLLAKLMKNRKLFHSFLRMAQTAQRPLTGGTQYIRHLPQIFAKDHGFKALPAIAAKPFRDRFAELKPRVDSPKYRVALFSGCVQDFVYPEQLEAALKVLAAHGVEVDFPMDQSCCGLPLQMMGEKKPALMWPDKTLQPWPESMSISLRSAPRAPRI